MTKTKHGLSRDNPNRDPAGPRSRRNVTRPKIRNESDIGSDLQGKNSLQGEDQASRRNQRSTTPDEG